MQTDTKKCGRCGEVRPRSDFGPDKNNKDGLRGYCQDCRREREATYKALKEQAQSPITKNEKDSETQESGHASSITMETLITGNGPDYVTQSALSETAPGIYEGPLNLDRPEETPETLPLPEVEVVEPQTLPVPSREVGPIAIVNAQEDDREWTPAEAQRCVESVRYGIKRLGAELLSFYRHKGWKAMGYATMEACLNPLFGIKSKQHFHHIVKAEEVKQSLIASKVLTPAETEVLNDSQLTVLAGVEDGKRAEVLMTAATAAGLSKGPGALGHKLTAKHLQAAADSVSGKTPAPTVTKTGPTDPTGVVAPTIPNTYADFLSARIDGEDVVIHLRHAGSKLLVRVPIIKLPMLPKGGK